jgi:hypothetical protein
MMVMEERPHGMVEEANESDAWAMKTDGTCSDSPIGIEPVQIKCRLARYMTWLYFRSMSVIKDNLVYSNRHFLDFLKEGFFKHRSLLSFEVDHG